MPSRILMLLLMVFSTVLYAQQTFPENGVFDDREGHYAFTNARIQVSPGKVIEKGTLIIKDGKVTAVGANLTIPKDAISIDLAGKYIYPSFIDPYSDYGMPDKAKRTNNNGYPQALTDKDGAYAWNEALKSEQRADQLFTTDAKKAKELRASGFGMVATHLQDGIARGTGALVFLGDESEHEMIFKAKAAAHYSFSKGTSSQDYPSSLMGAIALLRQTYYDAKWYAAHPKERDYNISLEKWLEIQKLPQIFQANHRLNILRADKIGDEFGKQYIFKGRGDEYRRLEAVKQAGGSLIIPINFPDAYDVSDPYEAEQVKLGQMLHWELAPSNPARLVEAGIEFALTAEGLESPKKFIEHLRKAYQHGLKEVDLWKAVTVNPAKMLKAENELGTLEKGKYANFMISTGPILSEGAEILHNWVKGKPYRMENLWAQDIRGTYELSVAGKSYELEIKGSLTKPQASYKEMPVDTTSKAQKLKLDYRNPSISFKMELEKDTMAEVPQQYRFSGIINGEDWKGQGMSPSGEWLPWSAKRTKAFEAEEIKLVEGDSSTKGEVIYPFVAYGHTAEEAPKQETVLFKNATVWTGEKEGNLENTDVLIKDGKIAKIGKKLKAPAGAKTVDATNKHLTAGIIDEHSHIAIQNGVNEGTQASSAEVRIGDVVNSDDVNLYRQLAGGVTMAQLLHGSANPIGGQAALIKFRWGKLPEEMKYKGAAGFIKFALGENVKQTNWGDRQRSRFPQTRMGVEQVYESYFTRAKEYGDARKAKGDEIRRDLELDALYEIINSERFITCHSYVQSEITMLMRAAERHGFKINTFTHILEGYKVADKMKEHGAGGSTFSDWWAYKNEVKEAIPYNAKVLDAMDVVTAINSDDAEMGRRLNQEAAKGVKYGNMSEEAAWNMVTLNPAKLLRCDDRVGSIKVGKDADVVLWTDNPLSIYAKAQQTYVDGTCYFDLDKDKAKRIALRAERMRLIQKMLNAKAGGAPVQKAKRAKKHHYHCSDIHLNELGGLDWLMD